MERFSAIAEERETFWLYCDTNPALLFTNNETNFQRLYNTASATPYVKDAFHDYIIHNNKNAVNLEQTGTKASAWYHLEIDSRQTTVIQLRFTNQQTNKPFDGTFINTFTQRQQQADEFYNALTPGLDDDRRNVQRQAFAGLLWSKQFYAYDVRNWLMGEIAPNLLLLVNGKLDAMPIGGRFTPKKLSPCPILGNILGLRLGI